MPIGSVAWHKRAPALRGVGVSIAHSLFSVAGLAVSLYRAAHYLNGRCATGAYVVKSLNHIITGCDISPRAKIGPGLVLFHPTGVVIGPDVIIESECIVMQGVTLGKGRNGSPIIESNVFLGPNVVVVGSVTVGAGSFIGANSVVTKSVPAGQMWRGNPAAFLRPM